MSTRASVVRPHGAKPDVRVVCEGYIVREGNRVVDASSTVTLVTSGAKSIVVDTGSSFRLDVLRCSLADATVDPTDVDFVVNTHLHADHCGGNDIFTSALKLSHRLERPPIGSVHVDEGHKLADGVWVAFTPGHSDGSVSVFVESSRRYAICGDAIPTKVNYETHAPPAVHIDRRLAIQSMARIIDWADIIIPGHGAPFEALGKK